MYEQEHSKYCYPDSEVLINVPGFKEQDQLDAFERMVTAERLRALNLRPLNGKFDKKHLCAIHKFIFRDVYPFAGSMRDEEISKGSFRFATARFLNDQTEELLNKLKQGNFLKELSFELLVDRLTYYLVELNVLHPFREGNGRTQREFIRCLALQAGYRIDWTKVEGSKILKAMIHSPLDDSELKVVMQKILSKE
ncbi:cell filamentation protein Fic [Brevibacillus nitrificans]|uniref:protein adenylyltransferase n=1 Tax=Brevibacillus nitrificans TaxID=651560 RepID=A0A3M8CRC1_9BACL|nr:Fic family protein [Brevibacillus nitrificans]RNB78089.1 cell filamentation protein Fic [Brevibacillus nitrificans]